MTDTVMKSDLKRVFVWTGQVAHLVDLHQIPLPDSHPDRLPSLCNYRPIWPGVWFDAQDDMPTCRTCDARKEAADSVPA